MTEPEEKCSICECEATDDYQGEPSCGNPECELLIQAALDYRDERDW